MHEEVHLHYQEKNPQIELDCSRNESKKLQNSKDSIQIPDAYVDLARSITLIYLIYIYIFYHQYHHLHHQHRRRRLHRRHYHHIQENKTSITLDILYDSPGSLDNVIQCFGKHSVNMSSIDSKLRSFARDGPVFNIDFDGALSEPKVQTMLMDLRMHCAELTINEPRECDWFPMNIRDLDLTRETLDGGTDLIDDNHPGFHDMEYRKRREEIVQIAQDYRHGTEITRIDYTENETKTWGVVYEKVMSMAQKYACREFLDVIPLMEKNCGYAVDNIPQLVDISNFLQQKTGFTLRPVQGLLSARDFLNALAFRVFFSTQYIRHHGNPL